MTLRNRGDFKKGMLLKSQNGEKIYIFRILDIAANKVFLIDCVKKSMPEWKELSVLQNLVDCEEEQLRETVKLTNTEIDSLDEYQQKTMYLRYTLISGILPFLTNTKIRVELIARTAEENNISKQTVRHYLCNYLVYQNIIALAPKAKELKAKVLSQNEKNFRWALNKYYYNKNKNSLKTAYILMLREKYCNGEGKLMASYPSYYQFRYYYRNNKQLQTYHISRDGLSNYQRNTRPLIGEGVQAFAPAPGVGMLDATICDIYLVNGAKQIVGRPILVACVDTYSGLCCGYSLLWEGGVYSIRNLLLNVIANKTEHCRKHGIEIQESEWPSIRMPGKLITDMGSEFKSENFEQITDLGVSITNLPSYRPELKGCVEKFFDVVQNYFKPHLRGKGGIELDFQERGAHDYRKDASLTLRQFEAVILYCIIFYNSKRIIESFPYTEEMLKAKIKPYPNAIWEWGCKQPGCNLLNISREKLLLTLLPRIVGKFTRYGLKVNGMRYHNQNYREQYLQGKEAVTAHNPEDVSKVWLIERGSYITFELIESRFEGKTLGEVEDMGQEKRNLIKQEHSVKIQAEIELADQILAIRNQTEQITGTRADIKGIRSTRKREQNKAHKNLLEEKEVK